MTYSDEAGSSTLEVSGLDATHLMSLQEKVMPWPNMPDAAIAAAIFGQYAIVPMVQPTAPSLVEPEGTTIQRGTDLRFLRKLARRNGFDFYVQPEPLTGLDQGFFRPRLPVGLPQAVLNVNMGAETNVAGFRVHYDMTQPTTVVAANLDTTTKSPQPALAPGVAPAAHGDRAGAHTGAAAADRAPRRRRASCAPATSSSSRRESRIVELRARRLGGGRGRRRRPPPGRPRERARRGAGLQRLVLPHARHAHDHRRRLHAAVRGAPQRRDDDRRRALRGAAADGRQRHRRQASTPSSGRPTASTASTAGSSLNNQDPLQTGRLQAVVPEVLGEIPSGWALPCAPYGGTQCGFFAIPPIGAGVWIEFEAGDPSRPIWAGTWWAAGEVPMDEKGVPAQTTTKILRSDFGLIVSLDDVQQTITLSDALGLNLMSIKVVQGTIEVKSLVRVVLEAPLIQHGQGAAAPGRLRRPAAHVPDAARDDVQRARAPGRAGGRDPSGHAGAARAAAHRRPRPR